MVLTQGRDPCEQDGDAPSTELGAGRKGAANAGLWTRGIRKDEVRSKRKMGRQSDRCKAM